jgi:amino-acid N-acetyltransferase
VPETPVEIREAAPGDLPAIRRLLAACGLPTADVGGAGQKFLAATRRGALVGCIGLEEHGRAGLLRSFAVAPGERRRGIGAALHDRAVGLARSHGIDELWILTTTARERALRSGFAEAARDEVPEGVRESAQFRGLCPASASCLRMGVR